MPSANTHRNLTPPEVARRFGVATVKVLTWIRIGRIGGA